MLSVTPISPPNGPGGRSPATSKELPLSLPAILGRGPLLKCSDVKVSRRHASIDWADADDDGVTIEALFSQPTFVEVAGVRSKLKSGEKATLKHGDTFGLLPHAAWYRINFPGAVRHEDNTSEAPETNNSTPQDSGVETECGPSSSTSDLLVQSKSHVAAAQPSKSHTLPMDDGSSSDTKMEAATHSPPCAADEIDSSAASPSATKKENVQPSSTTMVDVTNKVEETTAKSTTFTTTTTTSTPTANTPNPIPPTAPSSRARTLPSWMTQEPAATSSPKQQPPAAASKKKNTTRRKPRVKVAPPKRSGGQLSFSESEDDSASNSPVKGSKLSSPNRSKSKEDKNALKRALHQLSESDDEDTPHVTATETATRVSDPKITASTSADGVSNVSSADSNVPSANSSAKNTNVDAQDNNTGLQTRVTKAKQSQPRVGTADEEQASVSDTGRPARNGTNSPNTRAPAPNSVKSKSCVYGASCYRRNPQHKKDEAHPGDPDYASGGDSDNEDSDDDRPHCEFGVDCYRKNPDHRRQYKHTRIPQPQRRAKRKRAAQKYGGQHSDSDTPDEFDLEFLNDASSDDYAPSDSGGSDSERFPSQPLDEVEKNELKRMGKEAKKFIKRGK